MGGFSCSFQLAPLTAFPVKEVHKDWLKQRKQSSCWAQGQPGGTLSTHKINLNFCEFLIGSCGHLTINEKTSILTLLTIDIYLWAEGTCFPIHTHVMPFKLVILTGNFNAWNIELFSLISWTFLVSDRPPSSSYIHLENLKARGVHSAEHNPKG